MLAICAVGCDYSGRPKDIDRYTPPQMEKTFQTLFQQNCVGCHGAKGDVGPAPPLNDKLFLALIPDGELQHVIAEGRPGTPMPAFSSESGGHLTADQVAILASGVKTLGGSMTPAPNDAPKYVPKQRDKNGGGSSDAGLKAFARACASCHGDNGLGTKMMGPIHDVDFLALISDQALRRIVITGRPDLGMPNYAETKGRAKNFVPLTDQDVADLVALMASWRKGSADSGKGK